MSIKDLFDKGHSLVTIKNKTKDGLREDLESPRYIDAYSKKRILELDFYTTILFLRV